MSEDQIKKFLLELQNNKALFNKIKNLATADEISSIAFKFGYKFSGKELKAFSNKNIQGIRIKSQDTSPSYNFGESGN